VEPWGRAALGPLSPAIEAPLGCVDGQTPPDVPLGLRCRKCNCADFRTLETRKHMDKIVRRRVCRHCGWRVTTSEKIVG
jgi:hypothetical protein